MYHVTRGKDFDPRKDFDSRIARFVFTLMLAAVWTGAITDHETLRADPASTVPSAVLTTPAEAAVRFKPYVVQMERIFQAAEAADRDLPHEEFDVAALAKKIGNGPASAFCWVRDHTYWAPYRGVLRGPTGVLLDRAGNSLDRSLLLAAILQAGGNSVRIARGRFSDAQANTALGKVRSMPADRVPDPTESDEQSVNNLVEKYGKPFNLDISELRKNAETALLGYDRAAEDLAQRQTDQAAALRELVGKPFGDPRADLLGWSRQCIADHAWVQVMVGGQWIDLDPLLPDAKVGERAIEPTRTMLPGTSGPTSAVEDADWNQVELRVVIERNGPDGVRRTVVLKKMLRPAELIGERVVLSHINIGGVDINPFTAPDPAAAYRSAALTQREWAPVLMVGAEPIIQGSFDVTGQVKAKADLDPLAGTGKGAAGIGSAAAALLGDAPLQPSAPEGNFVGEWIEFEIHAPGRPVTTSRRALFDFTHPAMRSAGTQPSDSLTESQKLERGLAMLGVTDILLEVAESNGASMEHLTNHRFLANRDLLLGAMRDGSLIDQSKLPSLLSAITPPPGPLYSLAALRHRASSAAADTFIDRPDILTYCWQLEPIADGGIGVVAGFDIVSNGMGVKPNAGDPFGALLMQGVVDTNAEAVLALGDGDQPGQSTAESFAAARAAGQPWASIRVPEAVSVVGTHWSDAAKARVADELHAGYIVVAPPEPAIFAGKPGMVWWRIDPRTGETLGVNDRGQGTSMAEYTQLAIRIGLANYALFKCAQKVSASSLSSNAKAGLTLGCAVAFVMAISGFSLGNMEVNAGSIASTGSSLVGAGITYATSK